MIAESPARVLIVGCGYLGGYVARNASGLGHTVWAVTRRAERTAALSSAGLRPIVADWNDSRTLKRLPEVDRILVAVSYDRTRRLDRHQSQVGGLGRLLDAVRGDPHICYISTTGVYHQTDGCWVDETSPAHPRREAARVHLEAEQLLWRRRPTGSWSVLRLGGIYGPGRLPRAGDVVAGRPIRAAEAGYLNLIHLEDAARAVTAAWQRSDRRLYVVADDAPVRRGEFYREVARLCHAAPPRFEPLAQPGSERSGSNKRIWNRRMKRELLPRLTFPTYREGLAALADPLKRSRGGGG